ncbi:ExbD/TolR family protein [Microbulbifer agarilyticus]|uniref:Biopolymer transporter ExbD n=1 Tax=Microbulbifer agarilyticus TaxID=260552 RepID=A0A1Q2M1R9_9GAMM|nr:biopolymer transporter ExbD [Microbulbifer agarilyticus]AQQ66640.1 biopolymer transporter ExbD [Microbulbifer agarilyticus]MBY6190173.1 biopolymer transporter ExbD [Microbulbifer agarilyticus]MBY6210176.1 biopolymer transporter ExbD [Microbulbifer agarilyticus]MCA0892667.1 biopolymer transporter ExbD [Microbulbifer agarilyticus]MCA0899629.1 biopolymer transporter ExbD [Microbulbifer agarilyticus]
MSRKKNTAEEEGQAIDLTPMLDVVFIMLIFFIVTATFIKEPGVDVIKPEATTADLRAASILVAINDNNEIWIAKEKVDDRLVKNTLERLYAENPKGWLVIQPDKKASIEKVALIADAARKIGIDKVSVATEKS